MTSLLGFCGSNNPPTLFLLQLPILCVLASTHSMSRKMLQILLSGDLCIAPVSGLTIRTVPEGEFWHRSWCTYSTKGLHLVVPLAALKAGQSPKYNHRSQLFLLPRAGQVLPPWLHSAVFAQVTLQQLSLCGTEMPTMSSIGRLIFRYIWESEVLHYPQSTT